MTLLHTKEAFFTPVPADALSYLEQSLKEPKSLRRYLYNMFSQQHIVTDYRMSAP